MSYGCAKRRDSRRQAAIPRLQKLIESNKKEGRNSSIAEETLKNTQANMGKGTCAMQKNNRKAQINVAVN